MTSLLLLVWSVGVLAAWVTKRYRERWVFAALILLTNSVDAVVVDTTSMLMRAAHAFSITVWIFLLAAWFDKSGMACLRGHEWVTTAALADGGTVSFTSNDPIMVRRLMGAAMVPADSPQVRACDRCGTTNDTPTRAEIYESLRRAGEELRRVQDKPESE